MILNLRTGFFVSESGIFNLSDSYAQVTDVSGTLTLSQKKQAMAITGTFATAGTVVGSIAISQKKPTIALTGVTTKVSATIAVSQKKQSIAIQGTSVQPVAGTIAMAQKKPSIHIVGTAVHGASVYGALAVLQKKPSMSLIGISAISDFGNIGSVLSYMDGDNLVVLCDSANPLVSVSSDSLEIIVYV